MPGIFISYRRGDSDHIGWTIYERIRDSFEEFVFFDIDTIPLGIDFRNHIRRELDQCDLMLAIIGDHWISASDKPDSHRLHDTADFVRIEIEVALGRGIPVIPVLVGEAGIPGESDLPESLQGLRFRNAAKVRPGKDRRSDLDLLVAGIRGVARGIPRSNSAADEIRPEEFSGMGEDFKERLADDDVRTLGELSQLSDKRCLEIAENIRGVSQGLVQEWKDTAISMCLTALTAPGDPLMP